MKTLAVILVGLYVSWRYTDVQSEQALHSVWAPLACMVFLLALVVWAFGRLAVNAAGGSGGGYSGSSNSIGGGSDCSGSDGGGCD